ncbi:sequence-specific DNA-binding high mobility group box protein, partial [Cyathus striatus]
PRPPNAWILFRAVKQKELLESRGKEPQAEVSKMISQVWKDAPEDVRAHYERLAEEKKAEHKVQYPGYRFQPKKKEEK